MKANPCFKSLLQSAIHARLLLFPLAPMRSKKRFLWLGILNITHCFGLESDEIETITC